MAPYLLKSQATPYWEGHPNERDTEALPHARREAGRPGVVPHGENEVLPLYEFEPSADDVLAALLPLHGRYRFQET